MEKGQKIAGKKKETNSLTMVSYETHVNENISNADPQKIAQQSLQQTKSWMERSK